jgi:cysteinyl-tRNA synthetase
MSTIRLYNTLIRSKQEFIPTDINRVGMYVCGPTVYDKPHLGNALSVVTFDLLYRILCYKYGQDKVIYVRNITDVDDKIMVEARNRNIPIKQLTEEITDIFEKDMDALNCLHPNYQPKATEHINEMIDIIKLLIKNGNAYISDRHVYFAVTSFREYGLLSGRTHEQMLAGARVEIAESKQNPADFVLWKPAKDEDDVSAKFASPWGEGRPGWHIECSAMSSKYLGNVFDIHGGGVDLLFPHHTNEIAQSCCAFKTDKLANYWVHNGFLTVDGEKMSKSLGNFHTVQEILEQGIEGEIVRFVLLSTHYRKPLDWNNKVIDDAKKAIDGFYRAIEDINTNSDYLDNNFIQALYDDLNTPIAISVMHELAKEIHKTDNIKEKEHIQRKLKACGNLMGLLEQKASDWFKLDKIDKAYIEKRIHERNQAKQDKNWQLADYIREELKAQNIIIEDKPGGVTEWRKA